MAGILTIINALLWVVVGFFCIYGGLEDAIHGEGFMIVVAVFGGACIMNALACILKFRIWRVFTRVVGVVMILYGFDVLLLGHGEDIGGATPYFILIGASIGLGLWSLALPSFRACCGGQSQPCAPPNGGPAAADDDPIVTGGPPSVS